MTVSASATNLMKQAEQFLPYQTTESILGQSQNTSNNSFYLKTNQNMQNNSKKIKLMKKFSDYSSINTLKKKNKVIMSNYTINLDIPKP